ncbi:MAG TPA: alpha/beta hydrolase fold domain-containing protein [Terriglobales bacterium]|nr:alpha/beta hydrolase fold domain-containing protein [Terriglobales bacterium]
MPKFISAIIVILVLTTHALCADKFIPQSNTSYIDAQGTAHITRVVPIPKTISPEAQKSLARPMSDSDSETSIAEDRKQGEEEQERLAKEMQSAYPTTLTRDKISGVPVRIISPVNMPPENRDRVLLNVHGGGFQADWGSVSETVPIASLTKTKVVAVLYRLSPENPFPAAVDDTIAVYKELLKTYKPQKLVLYGTSAGAMLTAEVAVRLKQLGLPLPAALGILSGDGAMDVFGDSARIFTLDGLKGPLEMLKDGQPDPYTAKTNPRDPVLSPQYADLKGMPPTFFLTSERDALLSGTVNLHRAFVHAGVETQLMVFDGLPHAFWTDFPLPEADEANQLTADFFNKHLRN